MFGDRRIELHDYSTRYELCWGLGLGVKDALQGSFAAGLIRELAARRPLIACDISRWLGYSALDRDPVEMVVNELNAGRMYLVQHIDPAPSYSHRYEQRSKSAPPPKFEGNELTDDGPTLTRSVSITILDFHLDGGPLVNLPLHVVYDGGEHVSGKTNNEGTLVYVGLPPDRRFAVFSGRDPSAADTQD